MTKEELSRIIIQKGDDVAINIHVQPKSSKNSIQGLYQNSLKVSLTAPPVEGKANKELIKFISKFFSVPKSSIRIISGLKSRDKAILIKNVSKKSIICDFQ